MLDQRSGRFREYRGTRKYVSIAVEILLCGDRAVIVFNEILRQMIYERPLLALSLAEGLISVGY